MQEKIEYYSDYLYINELLACQHPRSLTYKTVAAYDEMLFIIVHQAFELWFKQTIYELDNVRETLKKDVISDNSEEMYRMTNRLERVIKILRLINQQFEVLDTMQPLDFLEFRNLLQPASGFQSKQFRLIEAKLGLKMSVRHNSQHYKNTDTHKGGFNQSDFEEIEKAETEPTLLEGLKKWLNRMPFLQNEMWGDYTSIFPNAVFENPYFSDYAQRYFEMRSNDEISMQDFKNVFFEKGTASGIFEASEMRAALFIVINRHQPLLQLPYELINSLIEIDSLLEQWRYLHISIVKKMIGRKPGTGGSPGAEYLKGAAQTNNVFNDLTYLSTYFIERDKLPNLSKTVKQKLQFH